MKFISPSDTFRIWCASIRVNFNSSTHFQLYGFILKLHYCFTQKEYKNCFVMKNAYSLLCAAESFSAMTLNSSVVIQCHPTQTFSNCSVLYFSLFISFLFCFDKYHIYLYFYIKQEVFLLNYDIQLHNVPPFHTP